MRRLLLAATLSVTAFVSVPAYAASNFDFGCINSPGGCALFQNEFRDISQDITGGLDYKALGPSEATGLSGIDIGAYVTYTPVQNKTSWKRVTGSDVDAVGMAGISLRKGLPFNIDVGVSLSAVPQTSAKVYGAEVRYAFLPGTNFTPAVALRAAYTASSGIDHFSFNTSSVDLSVSKGFTVFTPYAGVGYLRGNTNPDAISGLKDERVSKAKLFAGSRISLGFLDITPEYERVGNSNSYSLRVGLSI
jgi:hypothetical protein